MQIREIESLIMIDETKNMTLAARRLHVSQPALSQTIKRMEMKLGVPLINRGPKEISLTHAGEIVVSDGRQILRLRNNIVQKIDNFCDVLSEKLRIGITPLYAQVFFPGVYTLFHQRYPQVELSIFEGQGEEQEKLLLDGKIDIGIFAGPFTAKELIYDPIYFERMVLLMASGCERREHTYVDEKTGMSFVDLNKLREAPFLGFSPNRVNLSSKIEAICQEHDFSPNIVFRSSLSGVLKAMVSTGLGVSLISWMVVGNALSGVSVSGIDYFHVTGNSAERNYSCAYRKNSENSKIIKLFLKTCLDAHKDLVKNSREMQFFMDTRNMDWSTYPSEKARSERLEQDRH